jgi:hypothetical protein
VDDATRSAPGPPGGEPGDRPVDGPTGNGPTEDGPPEDGGHPWRWRAMLFAHRAGPDGTCLACPGQRWPCARRRHAERAERAARPGAEPAPRPDTAHRPTAEPER